MANLIKVHIFLKKGQFPASFNFRLFNTVDSKLNLPMIGSEPQTSGVGCRIRSSN